MKSSEFKVKVAELINITLEAEKKRYKIMSNRRLRSAGVNFKKIVTDAEVKAGWNKYNKYEADWEKYCRKAMSIKLPKDWYVDDYSHLAYNGVTDDF